MAQAFAVPFAATTDPSCAKRVFTATASEAAPFSVECASAAGGVVNSAALTGTYAAGATFDATVTAYNVLGEAGPATACTVTIVGTPAAADPISQVGLVTV